MSRFKLYDCDVGVVIGGVQYDFFDVNSIEVEDPENTNLTRGSNGKNMEGIAYKEGVRDPKTWTIPIMNMSNELKAAFDDAYKNTTRMDVYCTSRSSGSRKALSNAVLKQRPQQLTVDETADSLAIQLIFAGYDNKEVYK